MSIRDKIIIIKNAIKDEQHGKNNNNNNKNKLIKYPPK